MHLSDCFTDLIAYVSYLLKSVQTKPPVYEDVKEEIRRLISGSETYVAQGLVSSDEYDQARFALCAWIDEAILSSGWLQKNRWLNDQLQRFHYNTTDAGEAFFERLNTLEPHQRDVREVYYLCLALGFTGRYCHPADQSQLEQIKTTNLKLLIGSPLGLPSLEGADLFPEAHPCDAPQIGKPLRTGSRLAKAICLAAPLVLFGILYLVYHFTLSGIGENFLRTVAN